MNKIWFENTKLTSEKIARLGKVEDKRISLYKKDREHLEYLSDKYDISISEVIRQCVDKQYTFEKKEEKLNGYDKRIDKLANMIEDLSEKYNLGELDIDIVWNGGSTSDGYIFKVNTRGKKFSKLVSPETYIKSIIRIR